MWFASLITIVAVFVPFSPNMPKDGIDPSWMYGLNQAVTQKLSFVKELIFTFGPYASIYTQTYQSSTDGMMMGGALYLALSYWVCFIFVMNETQRRWILIYCATLAGLLAYWKDNLLFPLPLLAGLAACKILFQDEGKLVERKTTRFIVALLFAPFGLLVLVKGSLLILCGSIAALSSILFFVNKQRAFAAICILSPLISTALFWIVSGQSISVLPDYFLGMIPIISGYSDAMSLPGNPWEIAIFMVASILILRGICIQTHLVISAKVFLCSIYFVYLFISFKSGFVRQEFHAIIAGTAILIAALLLPSICKKGIMLPAIFAFLAWYYINNNYVETSIASIGNNIESIYFSAWYGVKNRMEDSNWPGSEYAAAVRTLKEQWIFPALQGTTDIYSFGQSQLIASGYRWSPRPVFQSYSAYTPELAEANKNHLLGSKAPDNVIFRVEPIDGRLPSLEDGASWPVLMLDYEPTFLTENESLFLRKKRTVGKIVNQLTAVNEKHIFGENVVLPSSNQPVYAKIDIEPTILGRLANILFKRPELQITLELRNGTKKQYRLIAGMARSKFLISPLIENTTEFAMLYGNNKFPNDNSVQSFVIGSHGSGTLFWNKKYLVTFMGAMVD